MYIFVAMEEELMLDHQVCFPIYALYREIVQQYRPMLDKLDLTYPQYLVLLVMWEHPLQTVNQIGQRLRLDSGTLTPLLKRMEQKGLISRRRSAQDERTVEISLTDTGKELSTNAKCIPGQMLDEMGITLEELLQLKTIANKILNRNH
ncbi:MarR family winged helix-turn-helix transcriptional regulator [Sphingobacterium spiritivorum]|uniref:MarR family winged helix-turn-helix transcriptional regulator n=2 Tax=Sphingobacterium spiritivorum TaxID=258 RepID=UPI003DA41C8B